MHRNEGPGRRRRGDGHGRGRRRTGDRHGHRLAGRIEQFRLAPEDERGGVVARRARLAVPPVFRIASGVRVRADAEEERAEEA